MGIPFEAAAPRGVVERRRRGESPRAFVSRLALEKASSLAGRHPGRWILGADTVVARGGRVYGKPRGAADLGRMLASLGGREHRVLTGFAVLAPDGRRFRGVGVSRVCFRKLGAAETAAYARTREPYDKAGGYAIQGTAAGWLRGLKGDYFNVMGLPAGAVIDALARSGFLSR